MHELLPILTEWPVFLPLLLSMIYFGVVKLGRISLFKSKSDQVNAMGDRY